MQSARQHHHPVFAAFGLTHHQHLAIKIHIFDTQAQPSIKRMPVPYSSLANQAIAPKRDTTSALVKTEGIRLGRVERWTSVSQGKLIASTSRYKNSKALSA